MNTISICLIVILAILTVVFVVSFVVDYYVHKKRNHSMFFQKEDRYKVIVIKDGCEYTIAHNLTLEQAKKEQTYTRAHTKIIKED